jgi:hypothetical protein
MAKNKQQLAAEARAKKLDNVQPAVGPNPGQINGDTGKLNEAPKPAAAAPTATAAPAPTVSKQTTEIARFQEALKAQGTDLSQMTVVPDGKFTLVVVGPGWPTAAFGPTGGLTIRELKSYAKAWDAGLNGKELLAKQTAREQKKVATPTPTPAAPAPAVQAPSNVPGAMTPAAKKAKAHAQVEQQLASATA